MQNDNHLTISGTVISEVNYQPDKVLYPFLIIHNGALNEKPFTLHCLFIHKGGNSFPFEKLRKGQRISLEAYLKEYRGNIQCVVKKFTFL